MKKLLLLVAVGLVMGGPARAQTFRPGWVLPKRGDTLRGEVEDDYWDDAPARVRFRPAAGAAIVAYPAAGLRAFRLAGGRYFRNETLPLDREAQTALLGLTTTVRRNPQPEAFLAEVLVDGPASLLRTAVGAVQHYFVRRENRPVLELAERNYLRPGDGPPMLLNGNNYRAELTQYFGDCPAAVQAIGAFQVAALVKVVQAYNRQCATPPRPGTEFRPATRQRAGGYAVGLAAGGRYNSYLLRADQPSPNTLLHDYNLDGAGHFVGGAFADVSTPGRRFALHLSLLLTHIGHSDQLAAPSPLVARLDNQATLFEIRIGPRYFWANTRQELHFFVGTGLTIPGALGHYEPALTYYDAGQQVQQVDYLPNAYPSSILPYLEAGVQKGRFTLAVDGRTDRQTSTYSIVSYLPQTGVLYLFTSNNYSGRAWYVGATLGVALLWKP